MNRLRNRLILILPSRRWRLWVTAWDFDIVALDWSLSQASTEELDQVSQSLGKTGSRELYQRACEALKQDAATLTHQPAAILLLALGNQWPAGPGVFSATADAETFCFGGNNGDRLDYLVRPRRRCSGGIPRAPHGIVSGSLSEPVCACSFCGRKPMARAIYAAACSTPFVLVAAIWIVAFCSR